MGDWSGFVDKLQEVVPKDQQPELLEKLSQGNFTLRIMYDQFQNILNMGPLKEVSIFFSNIIRLEQLKGLDDKTCEMLVWGCRFSQCCLELVLK